MSETAQRDVNRTHMEQIKKFIPELTKDLHKGSCGRVGIVGGCLEYTGAPYFAALSALKLGADLAYVLCCKEAAPVIKSYSPELIVYPFLDDAQARQKISNFLERLHSLVIGPGLGRDPGVLANAESIINYCNNEMQTPLPLVIDADGLFLVTQKPEIVKNYKGPVILTPNAMEYSRLCQRLSIKENECLRVAEALNAVILKKGAVDVICNGIHRKYMNLPDDEVTTSCNVPGSHRRCGGQGDILSGCTAVFVAWFVLEKYKNVEFNKIYHLRDIENKEKMDTSERRTIYRERFHGFSLACYGASAITRQCSLITFSRYGRSMTATDMIPEIQISFQHYFGK